MPLASASPAPAERVLASALSTGDALHLQVTSPSGRTVLAGRVVVSVSALAALPVEVEVSLDDGTTWTLAGSVETPGATVAWDTRPYSGRASVRASADDGTVEIAHVLVDNRPPRVALFGAHAARRSLAAGRIEADEAIEATAALSGRSLRPKTLLLRRVSPRALTLLGLPRRGRLTDGRYRLDVVAVDRAGNEARTSTSLVVDATPPTVSVRATASRAGEVVARVDARDRGALRATLHVPALGGRPLEVVAGVPRRGLLRLALRSGRRLPPGAHEVEVTVVDDAGNRAAATTTVRVRYPVRARIVSRVETRRRVLALTFDDCYHRAAWHRILAVLERERVTATFFCPGAAVLASPQAAAETAAHHVLGSHGWDHASFTSLSFGSALARLQRDDDVWWNRYHASATPFFRPPYGAYHLQTVRAAGAAGYTHFVLWDVDPRDWSHPTPATLTERVLREARPGSIVLLHVLDNTAAALPLLIRGLRSRGLEAIGLTDLLRQPDARPTARGWPGGRR